MPCSVRTAKAPTPAIRAPPPLLQIQGGGVIWVQQNLRNAAAFGNRRRMGGKLLGAEYGMPRRQAQVATRLSREVRRLAELVGEAVIHFCSIRLNQAHPAIAALQLPAHFLLKLEHRLIGVPPR